MVVRVNDVMREARVIRILRVQRLQNPDGAQLRRIGLVRRQGRLIHGQCMKDRRLDVLGILAHDFRHAALVRENPITLRRRRVVFEQRGDGGDVRPFARRRRARRARFLDSRETGLQRGRGARAAKWIAPIPERDAPVRDGARRICGEHRLEPFNGGAELERVQQRDGPIERGALGRRAAVLEAHGSELLARLRARMLLVLSAHERGCGGNGECHSDGQGSQHFWSP